MRKKWIGILMSTIFVSSLLYGCASNETAAAQGSLTETEEGNREDAQAAESENTADGDELFTDRDYETGYEEDESISIVLSDSGIEAGAGVTVENMTVTITAEGTYIVSGNLSDGQLIVDAAESAKIHLVFNNTEISSADSAPVYIKQADKVFLTLADGTTNILAVSGTFTQAGEEEDNIDAVIFSKADLTLNGNGSLQVTADSGNGITSKDDLVFTGGSYIVNAGNHGLEGKDSVRIAAGDYTITAGSDGIHSDNSEDEDKGFIYLLDGELTINAADDGIHAENNVTIDGGTITVADGYEGIEGMTIDINGGMIDIAVSDDGLNAAGGSDSSGMQGGDFPDMQIQGDTSGFYIRITGGILTIDAGGDGIDSNGSLYVSGGETYVSGPVNNGNGALDYNGTGEITGGIFVAAGASGMAMNFSDSSTQGSILVTTSAAQTGAVVLTDDAGTELLRFTPAKEYESVLISVPEITSDGSFQVSMGEETQEITMSGLIYGTGLGMGGRGSGRNGAGGTGEEMMTPPDNMELPDGAEAMEPPDGDGTMQAPDGQMGGRGGGPEKGAPGGQDGQTDSAE
ncbi:MAG: carbohydrate-binding domain-containing protein [Lachnospiraceae bacterium]